MLTLLLGHGTVSTVRRRKARRRRFHWAFGERRLLRAAIREECPEWRRWPLMARSRVLRAVRRRLDARLERFGSWPIRAVVREYFAEQRRQARVG